MSKENKTYTIVGLMSGTSLDGLDICLAEFRFDDQQWKFKLVSTKTIEYSEEWKRNLSTAPNLSGLELAVLDRKYGSYLGEIVKNNIANKADFIASHGHTIFHQIDKQLSLQIGHGAFIAAASGMDTISDFRSLDTAYGGQGAPLVPTAEKYLFPNTKVFLNIGGIANLSVHQKDAVIGFDICSANQVLNYLSQKHFDLDYDKNGSIARSGKREESLFDKLNQLSFYKKSHPKSLGREFTEKEILPLLDSSNAKAEDLLHTYTAHIAYQINSELSKYVDKGAVMITGGGAYNSFLIELLEESGISALIIDRQLIEYKEAFSFAFLGLLRVLKKKNVYSSISGASKDNIGGSIFIA